ncbi:PIG-L family deacetylase [Cellulomonas hominis]|uniref:PIG-L family deacetylase n=1 Tax=Cellulomonas hominis TaxID=156981 RepID=UPI001B98D3B3|nr:PIG-L family deacetylase [Cellulomonas hominis]VTR78068.1 1D-myo-inositol 2-acetamido-2-deoxy-alpha-D-glucopyranoside deacetylase [Cellulomonas hominis]
MHLTASTSPTGGVLAVHAHPDDETLTSGALLATWAAAGLPVTVVTCTRGERGEVIGAALAHLEGDGPALARHREREVAAAVAALGVRDHRFLDTLPAPVPPVLPGPRYEDSGMAWLGVGRAGGTGDVPSGAFVAVPLGDAVGRLAGLIRERRPDLVVTYEPGGGYGHPDHVRAHEVTTRAVELAADPAWGSGATWSPGVAWAVAPAGALRAGYAALADDPGVAAVLAAHADDRRATRESPLALPDPEGPLPSVAVPGPVDLVVDVRPVRDRVLAALRAHATQVQAVRPLDHPGAVACLALSNLVLAPVLPEECYRWAPRRAPRADLPLPPGARVAHPRDARPAPDVA